MRIISFVAAFALLSGSAFAQMPAAGDANTTCEEYLKMNVPQVKTGDAALDKMTAEIDGKINAYCKANPKAKLMEAAEKAIK
jgi:hypothetical protein